MDGVIGRPTGCHQRDDRVDDRALVDDPAQRTEVIAQRGDVQRTFGGFAGQCITQRRARVDERRTRQLHAHRFQQHLVGIGGAVEGAGASAVVRRGLGLQKLFAGGFAGGVAFAHFGLLLVRNARGHRAGRHEHRRQVAEGQCADQQARHDLVAHSEVDGGVEHVVAEPDGGRLCDHIAREQRQFHAASALGDAVAHRRHAAGHLCGGAQLAGDFADLLGIGLERLVRRQHVVVGGDDAQVRRHATAQAALVGAAAGGESVGEVAAAQAAAERALTQGGIDRGQIGGTRGGAAADDTLSDGLQLRMEAHWLPAFVVARGKRRRGAAADINQPSARAGARRPG